MPEYGVRAKRGDFEPLISEDLFYRVQSVLSGRVPIKAPPQRAHPDFPLRVRSLRVLWPSRADTPLVEEPPSTKVALREGATGAGLQVALEGDGSSLLGQLDGDVELPGTMTRRVGAATGIVVFEA